MAEARYTYGDSSFAADRLDLVARVFEPTSRRFIERAAPVTPVLALDLGCGPGNTTRLLASVLRPERTVGLDRSGPFLERASRGAPPGVEFMEHDVFVTPFPIGPAGVIYCRLLVAHLPDRPGVVARWTTQLEIAGVVLLDEIEAIRSDEPAFVEYLPIAIGVVERSGGHLFPGPELAALSDPTGTERVHDEVVTLEATASQIAPIFAMNLEVLVVQGEVEPRPELARALRIVAERGGGPIEWRMRQLAFRRMT
jgi:trans-aconitate 2-methyltransferase